MDVTKVGVSFQKCIKSCSCLYVDLNYYMFSVNLVSKGSVVQTLELASDIQTFAIIDFF